MRKFILIAGLVLASAAAQASDRSLSAVGSDALTAAVPAKVAETQKTAEAPQVAATQVTEAPKAEAPKYVERPGVGRTQNRDTQGEHSRIPNRISRLRRRRR